VSEQRSPREVILTLNCPDRVGIVSTVSGALAERDVNILESQQFFDRLTGKFFMRLQAALPDDLELATLRDDLSDIASPLELDWGLYDVAERPRILLLVSQFGHCLNDLLYRHRVGSLHADIAGVASNHRDFEALTEAAGIPFHYLPVTPETKPEQEAKILALVDELQVELVVLARYMQILSENMVSHLEGKAINIHHAFLPSFKGARPYHQAFERGVKLIGATAHYVTADLDEGPIIEQEVIRVDHSQLPNELVALGRDAECVALARAVEWHLEHRVMRNGNKTVVFK
jgi:formyltetrahydrofolate deformylase